MISGAVFQPDFAPIALTTVPSFANTPAPEVVALARRTTDGLVGVFARDALSGALVATHFLPADFRPFHLAAVPSFGGTSAWEVAVLGRRNADGLVRVTVLDARSGAVLRAYNQSLQFFPIGFRAVPDFSGNGVWELAAVGRRAVNQALRVRMHDASTGALVSQWLTDHTFQPTGFGVVTDVNGDGSADFAILGRRNPDGAVREWTRDSRTGAILALFGYPAAWLPLDLGIVPDFAGPLFDEGAVLRYRPTDGDVRVTLKDTSNGAFLAGRLFDSSFFPLDLEIVPSYAGGPADELAVWAERLSDGRQRIYLVDPASGANLGFVPVP